MGLVKFNQQTLTIDGVPDGHVIVADSEISTLKAQVNEFQRLKSFIPPGVDPSQIGPLLEKGSRYDAQATELAGSKAKITEFEGKLSAFNNLPKDFVEKPKESVDRWNQYVKAEQDAIRGKKIADLSKQVYDRVEKEEHARVEVDQRFIDPNKLAAFNPDDPKAVDSLYEILKEGLVSQLDFISKNSGSAVPAPANLGAGPAQPPAPVTNPKLHDRVSDTEVHVGGFGGR